MKTQCLIYLNGTGLHEYNRDVVIQRIDESKPSRTITTLAHGNRVGQSVTGISRDYAEIAVTFALRNRDDLVRRAQSLDDISAWAEEGGELTVNYRPGRRMVVETFQFPAVGYVREWTNEYTIIFRAYEVPYWESTALTTVNSNGRSSSIYVERDGNMPTPICFEARSLGGAVGALSISGYGDTMSFTGLGAGETLCVDYDDKNIQRVRIRGAGGSYRDATGNRSGADEIILKKKDNTITVSDASDIAWTITHRGRWS